MKKDDTRSSEIPPNNEWHSAVHAARVQHKSLYFVETICGQTVDVCLSEGMALSYIQNAPFKGENKDVRHQFRVFEQNKYGHLIEKKRI